MTTPPSPSSQPAGRRTLFAVLLVAASWLTAGVAAAQGTREARAARRATTSGEPMILRDAEHAIVDVHVARRGEPVRDIEVGDFRLEVDGQSVPIDGFEEIGHGSRLPVRYLIFIDDFFSIPSQRNRVLDGIRARLGELGARDRMAILAYDGETVEVLAGWTRLLPVLDEALLRARKRPSHGLLRLAEQRQFELSQRLSPPVHYSSGSFAGIGLTGSTQPNHGAISLRRAREITGQVANVMRAATASLYALPSDEGRHVMLLLSGGWQVSPDSWVVMRGDGKGPYTGIQAAESLFAPLIESADQRRYTLYPVAVPSWTTDEPTGNFDPLVDEMLTRLAVETGGQALLEARSVSKIFSLVAKDLESYYRLRFAPQWRHERRRQRLRVDVAGGRYRVRARLGLADPSRQQQINCLAESATYLERSLPGAEALTIAIEAGAGRQIPLRIRIAADAVTMRREGDQYVVDLELRVARFGVASPPEPEPILVRLTRTRLPERGDVLTHEARVRLPKKAKSLLVSVYDPRDGTLLAREVTMQQ